MRILIFIPKRMYGVDTNQKFVSTLSHCLSTMADVDVKNQIPSSLKDYSLIHVIGCWNHRIARAISKAKKQNIPTVITPLGSLEPWIIKKHRTEKILTHLHSRHKMIKNASAVHLCGDMEYKSFKTLDWNRCLQIIRNSLLTNEITDMDMAQQMMSLYQKTLDSNCYSKIGDDVEDAINYMLLAGIDFESFQTSMVKKDVNQALKSLTDDDWRHIFIYASDEGILSQIKKGLENVQFKSPDIVIDSIERFSPVFDINIEPLESTRLYSKSRILGRKIDDLTSDQGDEEKQICIMIHNIKFEIRKGVVSFRHLIDLYKAIKFKDYDEDKLADILKQTHIFKFASRIVFILKDVIGLTEGYMPIPATDDKTTDKLRKIITKLK